jgi:hypothetical protein
LRTAAHDLTCSTLKRLLGFCGRASLGADFIGCHDCLSLLTGASACFLVLDETIRQKGPGTAVTSNECLQVINFESLVIVFVGALDCPLSCGHHFGDRSPLVGREELLLLFPLFRALGLVNFNACSSKVPPTNVARD